jgi:hypothetical protein
MSEILTPYDEFPVHQASRPFSYIPSTDYNWDDGYYFGVFSAEQGVHLATGARINPNSDMIGGYALLNVRGHQTTLRFNRAWRRNFNVEVGPWKVAFVTPLRTIRLTLGANESGMEFDLTWEGSSPAFLEEHHVATIRGRRTTDQSRYSQPGVASGWISLGDERWDVTPDSWHAARDHSWGLYAERPPLSPIASLLPPRAVDDGPRRALRFWTCFHTGAFSGFYHLHETEDGVQTKMNDVFGTPFGGRLYRGWDDEVVELTAGEHRLELDANLMLVRGELDLTDDEGRIWRQIFEPSAPPWIVQTMGYHPGSWKDGGTFVTYHGSEELAIEWDAFDFSNQPSPYTPYAVTGQAAASTFGEGVQREAMVQGPEYLCKVTTIAPDGTEAVGAAQVEFFLNGHHARYNPRGDAA